jgi:hypothetical protein
MCSRLAGAAALGLSAYASYAAITWLRYDKHKRRPSPSNTDALLDRFMPTYEVADRHSIRVSTSAETTFAAAADCDLGQSAIVRAVFKARELALGSRPAEAAAPRGLLAQVKEIGWGVLAELPGREIVLGAATKPWKAEVVFRPIPPDEFADFGEPDHAKIVWTIRVDPISSGKSIAHTETRVGTTDSNARAKFRLYWSLVSPGIFLIRRVMLLAVKREAERRCPQVHLSETHHTESPAD